MIGLVGGVTFFYIIAVNQRKKRSLPIRQSLIRLVLCAGLGTYEAI